YLVSENLINNSSNITAISLDRYLSDHRHILLRERYVDYGPTPFKFFHYWLDIEVEMGEMRKSLEERRLLTKFKTLTVFLQRNLQIKWAIEGDENSKFFHGMLNKKRSSMGVRGVMVDGEWVDDPQQVKKEFYDHFSARFSMPNNKDASILMDFPKKISESQLRGLECEVSNDEIKKAVWDCGTKKAPGPDGFNFGFLWHFWYLIHNEIYGAVSLIGSIYKSIAKILVNRLVGVLDDIVNEVQSAFVADRQIIDGPFILNEVIQWCKVKRKQALIFKVDFEKAYDSVRWDFLDEVLRKFGFGDKWCKWIQCCLNSSRGSILVNGSPTEEFQFGKGLKQATWVNWKKSLVAKDRGGLGISSLYAMNKGLLLKWVWRFVSQKNTLWARVIQALHGVDGKIGTMLKCGHRSCWTSIIQEMNNMDQKGINFMSFICIKLGNGENRFWEDKWCAEAILKIKYPRLFALESCKLISVGTILSHPCIYSSFRRKPRGGSELDQLARLGDVLKEVILSSNKDRWVSDLESTGEFSVSSIRNLIDKKILPDVELKTRWNKFITIKINIHTWKIMTNSLPTRFNISCRGICIDSILCATCDRGVETASHLFFSCSVARDVVKLITRWWCIEDVELESFDDWENWFDNIRLPQ
nr:RNA-directed DNA polymerase, eukaryota, reverse transcriptase zinc-binding domain protein [Tanacetum cinerariifolium]